MKYKGLLGCLFILMFTSVWSVPLKIAIAVHEPPFIFQEGRNQYSGFDIAMMNFICKKIDRPCQFMPFAFKDIINNVVSGTVDVGVSSLTITPQRQQKVNFSIPYLPSYCQFMVKSTFNQPYSLSVLKKYRIGYVNGTLFPDLLISLDVDSSQLQGYDDEFRLIDALNLNRIDIAIADAPSTAYWVNYSNGKFKSLGDPFKFGIGLAIAIRPDEDELVSQINQALTEYQNTDDYKQHVKFFIEADFPSNESDFN